MPGFLEKLYQKSQLQFALVWIGIYCVAQSLANLMSDLIGVNSSVTFVVSAVLTLILYCWIRKKDLMEVYGLCAAKAPAAKFLWYIPLVLTVMHNLWCGVGINLPAVDTVFYIGSMLCVGFLEEIIFRGFLFKALAKDDVKMAIIISSVTFGVGHLLNLINGSGMELVDNLCQVVGAMAVGFLFVILFHRGGSLVPCIIAHGVNNAVSVFANEAALTVEKRILLSVINIAIVVVYTLILLKTLPKPAAQQK